MYLVDQSKFCKLLSFFYPRYSISAYYFHPSCWMLQVKRAQLHVIETFPTKFPKLILKSLSNFEWNWQKVSIENWILVFFWHHLLSSFFFGKTRQIFLIFICSFPANWAFASLENCFHRFIERYMVLENFFFCQNMFSWCYMHHRRGGQKVCAKVFCKPLEGMVKWRVWQPQKLSHFGSNCLKIFRENASQNNNRYTNWKDTCYVQLNIAQNIASCRSYTRRGNNWTTNKSFLCNTISLNQELFIGFPKFSP